MRKIHLFFLSVILVSLWGTLPAVACSCRSKRSSVKANMHTLQNALEKYAIDFGGIYPKNLRDLEKSARAQGYWEDFQNPYTHQRGYQLSWGSFTHWKRTTGYNPQVKPSLFGLRIRSPQREALQPQIKAQAGMVLYESVSPTHYRIYATDDDGRLITDRHKLFVLSND